MLSASGHSINTESHNSQSGNEVNASTTQHLCVDSLPTIAITPPPLTDSPSKPTAKALNRGLAALPTAICAYYLNSIKGIGQGCLRVNCKFFHGTEEQLAELRKRHKRLKSPGGSSNASTRSASSNRSGGSKSSKRSRDRERKKKEKEDPPARLKMVKDADLGNKKPIVCLNYLTDTCNRPGCRFLHLPANIRPLPMTVCDYFSAGNCMRKRCRFFHGTQEVLTRMHAKGVTMYNPLTNEAHDPSTSLEELIKLQERTTVPLSTTGIGAAQPQQPPMGFAPHHSTLYADPHALLPFPAHSVPYTSTAPNAGGTSVTVNGTVLPAARMVGAPASYPYAQAPYQAGGNYMHHHPQPQPQGHTTIIIHQNSSADDGLVNNYSHAYPMPQHHAAGGTHTTLRGLPDHILSAILSQHPGSTIISSSTAPQPPPQQQHLTIPTQSFAHGNAMYPYGTQAAGPYVLSSQPSNQQPIGPYGATHPIGIQKPYPQQLNHQGPQWIGM